MNLNFLKRTSFVLIMLFLSFLFIEILSEVFVFHRYHHDISEILQDKSRWASGLILRKSLGSMKNDSTFTRKSSNPEPFRSPDSTHGYRINPGSYEVTYRRKHYDSLQKFKFHVTIKQDGSRFVGTPPYPTERDVYVFGDSFVFGEGVNDEQTFTYLLQSRFPNTRFNLFAGSGYSLTNASLNFNKLSQNIGEEDVLILGYADFYGVRHVAAPSRLQWWGEPNGEFYDPRIFKHVRASLVSDSLIFDKVPLFCEYFGDYCDQSDPSQSYIDSVTVRLINDITNKTKAKVYLLHFHGSLRKSMIDALHPRVRLIRATAEDFDFLMRDDINGFDGHPGPYWNHAIYKRLADTLTNIGLK
jgi:hypothetical protein